MPIVSDIMTSLDNTIRDTGQRLFENTSAAVGPIWSILLTISLLLVGMNMALGVYRMSARDNVQLVTRIVLIYMFAFSWENFSAFYDAVSSGSSNLALSYFNTAYAHGSGSIDSAMDGFAANMGDTADGVARSVGSIARGVLGALFYVFLAALMAIYVLVAGFAKIMLAMLIGVAPLAIIFSIFNRTKSLFEAWLSSFISYLMYPIAASAVLSTVVTVAAGQFRSQDQVQNVGSILGFLVIVFVGIVAIYKIPEAVNHMTGQIHLASIAPEALRLGTGTLRASGQVAANAAGASAVAHPKSFLGGLTGLAPTGGLQSTGQRTAKEAGTAIRAKIAAIRVIRGK